jgi:hypothetical protein
MKKIFEFVSMILIIIFCSQNLLNAKTTITYDFTLGGIPITPGGELEFAQQYQDRADLNGPNFANAYAFSNILGYPVGKSTLGTFPHFEIGVALGTGLTNMEYFEDGSTAKDEGALPGIAPSPVLHFGFGLAGGFDVLGKFFTMNSNLYSPDINQTNFRLEKFNMYSFGGKIRYNWLKETTIIPFVLTFGGLTFSLGGDFMRGNIITGGTYEATFSGIELGPPISGARDLALAGDYTAALKWYQMSVSFQTLIYFDILYLFSIYTGFGLSVGKGWFEIDFDVFADATDTATSTQLGTVTLVSENKYQPDNFLPTSIFGLELNLGFIKLNAETMVNLRNRSDVSVLVGTRFQF